MPLPPHTQHAQRVTLGESTTSGDPSHREVHRMALTGVELPLRSATHRSTVDVVLPDGRSAGWFRKGEWGGDPARLGDYSARLVLTSGGLMADVNLRSPTVTTSAKAAINAALAEARAASQAACAEINTSTTRHSPVVTTTKKETEMTTTYAQQFTTFINANKAAATTAGYMEAGRIANRQAAKLASKHLPLMLRGYADTPLGKLVLANIASVAVKQLRPNDPTLNQLTEAMTVQAFQDILQSFDIDGFIDGLLESKEIKTAVSRLPGAKAGKAKAAE